MCTTDVYKASERERVTLWLPGKDGDLRFILKKKQSKPDV